MLRIWWALMEVEKIVHSETHVTFGQDNKSLSEYPMWGMFTSLPVKAYTRTVS